MLSFQKLLYRQILHPKRILFLRVFEKNYLQNHVSFFNTAQKGDIL